MENQIAWALRHGHADDHQRMHALIESLHVLAMRYPPPASKTPAEKPADQA